MTKPVFLLTALLAIVGPLLAQEPVPVGEFTASATVEGKVKNPQGRSLENIRIAVKDKDGHQVTSGFTDIAGKFSLTVPSGDKYKLEASGDGFKEKYKKFSLNPNQTGTVDLILDGPIPIGEPGIHPLPGTAIPPAARTIHLDVPQPSDVPLPITEVAVTEAQFGTSTDMVIWLNGQAARNIRLQTVLTIGGAANIFTWIAHQGVDQYLALPVDKTSKADDVKKALQAYPAATLIGTAIVNHQTFLILRNNP